MTSGERTRPRGPGTGPQNTEVCVMGIFAKLGCVIAAPFVITGCAMGAAGTLLIGVPAAAGACLIAGLDDCIK